MFGKKKEKLSKEDRDKRSDRELWGKFYDTLINTNVGTNSVKDFYGIANAVREFERTMSIWLLHDSKRIDVVYRDGMCMNIHDLVLPKMVFRSDLYAEVREKVLSMGDYYMVWNYIQKTLGRGWVEYTEGERWMLMFVMLNRAYELAYERWRR
ncbi:MAG: hypothetical protein IIY21_14995 [Clostridiales bacterium]|nr:hypothetical protein [Clostridiales bacterium]